MLAPTAPLFCTAPNLLRFWYIGDEVERTLRRPWWTELQSRYGNMFFIRDKVRWLHAPPTLGGVDMLHGASA